MVKGYSDCNPSLKEKSLCVGTKTDKSITQSGLKVGEKRGNTFGIYNKSEIQQ